MSITTYPHNPNATILVGTPLAGKTSFRRKEISFDEEICYINRDEIRKSMFGKFYKHSSYNEKEVTHCQDQIIDMWVSKGKDIIVDNTNLNIKDLNHILKQIPENYNISFVLFKVPLYKLYVRNIKRFFTEGRWIPLKVIRNMYKKFPKTEKYLKDNYAERILYK